MTTIDAVTTEPQIDACEDIALTIPWYVNGTLDADAAARVEAHCDICPDCADDLAFERRLRAGVQESALADKAIEPGLARVVASTGPVPMRHPGRGPVRPTQRTGRMLGAMAALAACVAIAVATVLVEGEGTGPAYQTATEAGDTASLIRLQAAPDVPREALQHLFVETGVEVLSGPSDEGVYTLRSTGSDRPASAVAAALEATPMVLLAIAPAP